MSKWNLKERKLLIHTHAKVSLCRAQTFILRLGGIKQRIYSMAIYFKFLDSNFIQSKYLNNKRFLTSNVTEN